jgi:prophage DNA circulation protein
LSIDSALSGAKSLTNELSSGANVIASFGSSLNALAGGGPASKASIAKPAALRGVPFVLLEGDGHFGRHVVVHEYPYRDDVWAEDLGRAARRISVRGFIVTDGQGDCVAKRDKLIEACEKKGQATLSHPTYGEVKGALLGPLSIQERWDKQRMFELSFTFIESRLQEFPGADAATGTNVKAAAASVDAASSKSFLQAAASALQKGAAVVAGAVGQVMTWVNTAQRLANDATNLKNLIKQLPGDFGRFVGQIKGLFGGSSSSSQGATVATLIAQASVARQGVAAAGNGLTAAAVALSPTSTDVFAVAVQAQAAAVLAAANDPADGIRLLLTLAQPVAQPAAPASPIGQAITTVQRATADLFRRAAVASLARASADYQPRSADDAAAVRATVCRSLDSEISIAADQYEDATYNALRVLRAAVSADLTARGAGLPSAITISTRMPMPALALAQRVYRDVGRADSMVAQSGAVHPAFMPTSFKALE